MNILFLNIFQPSGNASGGIARVTCNLGNLFTLNGHRCRLAYYNGSGRKDEDCFEESVQLTLHNEKHQLEPFAASSDVVIIQVQMTKAYMHLIPLFDLFRAKYGTKFVYCHHTVPFSEAEGYDLKYLWFLIFHSKLKFVERIKESLWCLTSICFPGFSVRKIAKRRKYVTDHTDKTVLLSESFIPQYLKYVKCPKEKVVGIGNCCTFKETIPISDLEAKEKTILVVANMNERAKRISAVLEIWKEISKKDFSKGWNLIIVGDGEDLGYYRYKAKQLKLTNCSFEGKQNPLPYYRKSSILLMTSAFEGFGMVILEAQQMGCVPVSFESSSSIHDIINNEENGIIVPNFDRKVFINKLHELMDDSYKLKKMSINCLKNKERFSDSSVYSKWVTILNPDNSHNNYRL